MEFHYDIGSIQIRGGGYEFCVQKNIPFCVGTEGCVESFVYNVKCFFEQEYNKVDIIIVTPRVSEAYSAVVEELVIELYQRYNVLYMVVNDYGFLFQIQKYNWKNIILGRTLIRSLSFTPWHKQIVADENETMKQNIMGYNIVHRSKIKLFLDMGVVGVELCQNPYLDETVRFLHENGIKTWLHYNTIIGAIGRTCIYKRHYNAYQKNCCELCANKLEFKISKVWTGRSTEEIDQELMGIDTIPPYFCKENVVYYVVDDTYIPKEIDALIYDCEIYVSKV